MEGGVLILRHFLHLAIEFGRGSLVDTAGFRQSACTHRLQYAKDTRSVNVRCELRRVERHLHMRLRGKVVNLIGAHLTNDLD